MTDVDQIERDYQARLATRCTEWIAKHPEEAATIRQDVLSALVPLGISEPPPESFRGYVIQQLTFEAIRVRKGWPSIREFSKL